MGWTALSPDEVRRRVHAALDANRSYRDHDILGLPGTLLDPKVFPATPEVLARPWLRTAVENPNHIGCHTLGSSEPAFMGTHSLEREVISICAEQILRAEPGTVDGYIASGGTESNIQAVWAFRNAWRAGGVSPAQVGILCSVDTHYSMHKAADLLSVGIETIGVDEWSRQMTPATIEAALDRFQAADHTHAIVVFTMGTTMFGSIDAPAPLLDALDARGIAAMVHVDAAFGGFIYPFTRPDQPLGFHHPRVHSVTLDAHKMLQAPYGTGIHLIRKGLIDHTTTSAASYVPGLDCTLAGSRAGANAIAVWMILHTWGSEGGQAFVCGLTQRARHLAENLRAREIPVHHTPGMNLVVMRDVHIPPAISKRFMLVADNHQAPRWRKVVVMDHVDDDAITFFLEALDAARSSEQ